MRGRKPKPTQLKELEGNPGKRRLNASEPVYTVPDRTPYAPRHLSVEAQRKWREVVPLLMRAQVLTIADLTALELYCQAYGRWVEAEEKVAKSGAVLKSAETGGLYQNPYLAVANKAYEQITRMQAEFGLTPSSRARVTMVGKQEPQSLAEMLFEIATGQDVSVGDEAKVETDSDAEAI